jgi:hypothetical protein
MSRRQRRRGEKRRRHAGEHEGHLGRSLATGAGVTVGATLLIGGVAQAACTCTVDSLSDPTEAGHTTLRDAIASANELGNADSTITFASGLSGTITLNGTELPPITNSTVINGPGAGQIAIDGDDASRIFEVSASDVTIAGLTATNGSITGAGGGIFLQAGHLSLSNSVVSGNTSTGHGAGIYVNTGTLTVDSSTISDNHATADYGGGIGTNGGMSGAGATTIQNSTISGNSAALFGGGAYFNYRSPATVMNSTIYDNASDEGAGLYHFGQPVVGSQGLVVTGSTITHNDASVRGGGIASSGTSTQPRMRNTIVSGNSAPDGPDVSADGGSMDAAFSLIGAVDPDATINQTGPDIFGQDPQLGPLADNGGPAETQKPAATSPVIDAGSAFGLTSDQRGRGRPFDAPTIANVAGGDAADIGAVELQASDVPPAPATPTTPATPAPPATPASPVKRKKCKKKHKRSAESAKKKKCKKKKLKK